MNSSLHDDDDDDDDDDDGDGELFYGMVDQRKAFNLISSQRLTIMRDSHHRKSPTRLEHDLSLRRT